MTNNNTYSQVNLYLTVALIATLVIIYIWLQTGTMKCQFVAISGSPCTSCGLTRDIIQYLSFDFSQGVNTYSLRVFILLTGQIVVRGLLALSSLSNKYLIIGDILISIMWVGYAMLPLIIDMTKSQLI